MLPAKIYECLATGRPIVATPLPELTAGFSAHLRFATVGEVWVRAAEAAVQADDPGTRAGRIALARDNSWAVRFAELQALLADLETP